MTNSTKFEFGDAKLWIGGQWLDTSDLLPVVNKFDDSPIGSIPQADEALVMRAVAEAKKAAPVMAEMPAYRRSEILLETARLIRENGEEFARTIAAEAGKALKFARVEVERSVSTFTFAGEEAKRIHGQTVPLDAVHGGEGYFGFYQRKPVGVIAAISSFNFPLNLVAHKVAPALAAGNSVVLKPASSTPLSSVLLCRVLEQAGLPPGALNLVAGPGATVGEALTTHPDVAMVTFTGSSEVGRGISALAGLKKLSLELGNNSPVILAADADIADAARRCALAAFYNAGQVCVSLQRAYCLHSNHDAFAEQWTSATQKLVTGDPLDERVDVGPMISRREAQRVESWVSAAVEGGAAILTGGGREGALHFPTLLDGVTDKMQVMQDEVFGPVASLLPCDSFEEALERADNSRYGLQAAVFTRDLQKAMLAIGKLNFGGVIINDTPAFRTDNMPYGGNRESGLGREGVPFAVEEMTNLQMVAIRLDA